MNKIVIKPHNCSREEYAELVEYLEQQSWDFVKLKTKTKKVEKVKNTLDEIIDLAEDTIQAMPQKGQLQSECQRMCLQQAINEFSYVVNGIEKSDLKH